MIETSVGTWAHLRLDALEITDAEATHLWRKGPNGRDGALGFPVPASIEMEREWIRGFQRCGLDSDICLAVRNASDSLVGYVQWRNIDWIGRVAEFGIVIAPCERGKGLGTHALGLATCFAWEVLGLRRMWLRVVEFNESAIRLYETAGWRHEGSLVQHAFRQGRFWDVHIMGLLRPDKLATGGGINGGGD